MMSLVDGRGAGFLREFLDRFRRSGGVPPQVTDELAAELGPLFEALDALDREAAAVRSEAARRNAALRESATREVERILAAGRGDAERERVRVVEGARRAAAAKTGQIRSASAAEADRIRARGRDRIDALVALVVRCVEEGAA
jgi:hypothetical protein